MRAAHVSPPWLGRRGGERSAAGGRASTTAAHDHERDGDADERRRRPVPTAVVVDARRRRSRRTGRRRGRALGDVGVDALVGGDLLEPVGVRAGARGDEHDEQRRRRPGRRRRHEGGDEMRRRGHRQRTPAPATARPASTARPRAPYTRSGRIAITDADGERRDDPLADADQDVDADHRPGDGADRHGVVAADRRTRRRTAMAASTGAANAASPAADASPTAPSSARAARGQRGRSP